MWIGLPSLVLRTDWRARRRTRTAPLLRSRRGGFVAPSLTPDRAVIVIREDNQDSEFRISPEGEVKCPMPDSGVGIGHFEEKLAAAYSPTTSRSQYHRR